MTTRATARQDLLSSLEPSGFRSGRIDLPTIWPAVSAWMRQAASDLAPEGDERTFYLSDAPRGEAGFAGSPPMQLAEIDLICIELGRNFNDPAPSVTRCLGSVGVVVWYAASGSWASLREMPDWIDMGPGTPHVDWYARGDAVEWLITEIRASLVYEIAARQQALAAEVFDSAFESSLLVLAAPEQTDLHPG